MTLFLQILVGVVLYFGAAFATGTVVGRRFTEDKDPSEPVVFGLFWPITLIAYLLILAYDEITGEPKQ